ncbi:MAG: hypothetical protein KY464_09445 [Gemmatimonadetes bacterium]|nr:hypothetical protein [Gemmatimonadota bacterium]
MFSAAKRAKHAVRRYAYSGTGHPERNTFGVPQLDAESAALEARVANIIRASIKSMDDDARRRAIASPTPAGTIAEVVSAAPDVGLPGESAHARALARGAALKQRMLMQAGGALTSGQVAAVLGLTAQGVKSRAERRKLLSVPLSGGKWGFPALQFAGNDVRPGIPEVVSEAGRREMGAWYLLSLLLEPAPEHDTMLEALADPAIRGGFIARLRTYGEQQAS